MTDLTVTYIPDIPILISYIVDRFLKAIAWLRVEDDKGEDKGEQSQL